MEKKINNNEEEDDEEEETYGESSTGELVVVVVDGGTESESPETWSGGRIQQTSVSTNGHQQRTEDQQTNHQRPSPNFIHIGQKFKLSPTKILSENRVKGRCSYSNRGQNVFTSG